MKFKLTDDVSKRRLDENGRLIVDDCILTAVQINNYRGEEIEGWERLGLISDKVYRVFRPPEILEGIVGTFEGMPLMTDHTFDNPDSKDKMKRIGAIMNPRAENDKILGSVSVWDSDEIVLVDNKEKEDLSVGWENVDLEVVSGEYNGEPYDIKILYAKPNHVALCFKGRVSGAKIADYAKEVIEDDKGNQKQTIKIKGELKMAKFKLKDSVLKIFKSKGVELTDEEIEEIEDNVEETLEDSPDERIKAALIGIIEEEKISQVIEALKGIVGEGAERETATPDTQPNVTTPEAEDNKPSSDEIIAKIKELLKAGAEVEVDTGKLELQDSIEDYYEAGLKARGVDISKLNKADFRGMYQGLKMADTSKAKLKDTDNSGANDVFKNTLDKLSKLA